MKFLALNLRGNANTNEPQVVSVQHQQLMTGGSPPPGPSATLGPNNADEFIHTSPWAYVSFSRVYHQQSVETTVHRCK
ncbi:unnamed protein product [Boreogadus saida]